jgi:hypothetical protein
MLKKVLKIISTGKTIKLITTILFNYYRIIAQEKEVLLQKILNLLEKDKIETLSEMDRM